MNDVAPKPPAPPTRPWPVNVRLGVFSFWLLMLGFFIAGLAAFNLSQDKSVMISDVMPSLSVAIASTVSSMLCSILSRSFKASLGCAWQASLVVLVVLSFWSVIFGFFNDSPSSITSLSFWSVATAMLSMKLLVSTKSLGLGVFSHSK